MAQSKPNKSLKSPNIQQNEEQKKTQNNTQSVIPHTMKKNTKATRTEKTNEQTEKRDIPQGKYEQNP
jgi:hypothetical protein